MAKFKSYRRNDESLRALETLKPLVQGIKKVIRGWWMTILYLYLVTFVLLYFAKTHTTAVSIAFVIHAIIVLIVYFKNNKRNGSLYVLLKDYNNVKSLILLSRPYKNLLNFTYLIIVLDALLWPVIFPIKFVFWFMYRIFKFRVRKVRKLIMKGGLVLIPDEDEIAADPFYHFLIREGLYDDALTLADKDDAEEANELAGEEEEESEQEEKTEEGDEVKEEEKDAK